jgi:MoxR-like ATPase
MIDYLPEKDEIAVVQQTTSRLPQAVQGVFSGEDVLRFQALVRNVPVAEDVVRYAVRLAASSRPKQANAPDFVKNWINWGAGTRAAQALVLGAKARVLWKGGTHVTVDDIRALAAPVFRHRLLLNYRAEADGVSVEQVIEKLVAAMPNRV